MCMRMMKISAQFLLSIMPSFIVSDALSLHYATKYANTVIAVIPYTMLQRAMQRMLWVSQLRHLYLIYSGSIHLLKTWISLKVYMGT